MATSKTTESSSGETGPDFAKISVEEALKKLGSSTEGLNADEAANRLQQYGPNALEQKKRSPILQFLSYFWGPIPWMIEVAAVLSAVVRHLPDLIIVLVLLLFNAVIGFWQEHKAANAVEALKSQLALKARARRAGQWTEVDAAGLVPGDIIRLRLGDIIPADAKLIDGEYLSVDQSAMTGESLPVTKKAGEIVFSGSIAKQGEMIGVATATGASTFLGRTAKLVAGAGAVSHFQKAVLRIGNFLVFIALGLSVLLLGVELFRGQAILSLLQFILILVVASIPVAMPAVLSVTMALGALALSKRKAIVSRLQSIEEMAGIDILCSDKTGTLTQNKLTLGDPVLFAAPDTEALILAAALASKAENQDAIDLAVLGGLADQQGLADYEQLKFMPFDPVDKRTEASIKDKQGRSFRVSKGAPQVIAAMSRLEADDKERAEQTVNELAAKGYRTLGVAQSDDGESWRFLGILSLYDPPREDSRETIDQAKQHGIGVKMVTGDNIAIAREISDGLGLGRNIHPAGDLFDERGQAVSDAATAIEVADGFAEVFPEHKYGIVRTLQDSGHLVGMTGDGVNDAPPLKQADVGIAVSGATDAARAAADLILTMPGLSVIIQAVEEARRIFERMLSYTIYRIAMTINIMVFVVLAMLVFDTYPLTAIMIIALALLDDIPIMTIAYDNTRLEPKPVRWDMHRVLMISSLLGFLSVVETFGLLYLGEKVLMVDQAHLQTAVFLQLVVGGHLLLFVTRSKRFFLRPPLPSWQLFGAIVATQIFAVLMTGFGWFVPALPWRYIGLVWLYNLVWLLFLDCCKLGTYRMVEHRTRHHRPLTDMPNRSLHSHAHLAR